MRQRGQIDNSTIFVNGS